MSTLTSSPSPAASPRAAFHIQSHHHHILHSRVRPASSPRQAPRQQASPDSPRIVNASSDSSLSTSLKERRPGLVERLEDTSLISTERFVDAGTQYSPDGSPPTSNRKPTLATTTTLQPQSSTGSAKKRKEIARSESPPVQMSGASDSAPSAAGPDTHIARPSPSGGRPEETGDPQRPGAIAQEHHKSRVAEPQEARSTHGHSSAPKKSRPEPGSVIIMPLAYETCKPKDLGYLISNMLMELIRLNDQIPLRDGRLTRFHSRAPPAISVSDYLQRLIQHATLSPPILLSMVYYIDRLCLLYTPFTINSLTVHRFLITAATVATKGLSDAFWTNPTYARVGGIPVSELATLELEFLQKVEWKIVPQPEALEDYYRSLIDRTQGYELEVMAGGSESSSLDESNDSLSKDDDSEMIEEPT